MGEQRNLTEENVDEMKAHLEKMQEGNPDLEYRFFEQGEDEQPSNKEIFEKLEMIERRMSLIFADYVLIDGAFRKLGVDSQPIQPM